MSSGCARIVIGDHLANDVDFDAVFEATIGYMPAFVREAIERALRYTMARTGKVGPITTIDLVHACGSLRGQFDLHMAAQRPTRQAAGVWIAMFREMFNQRGQRRYQRPARCRGDVVERKLHGAELRDADSGEPRLRDPDHPLMPFINNTKWIIIHGNPGDGFAYFGPFTTVEEAMRWAENNLDRDWWIADLSKP